jgi:CheY-like chemotaxis protein/two-component sensor histidine kinase
MESARISQGRLELRKQRLNIVDLVQNAVESSHALMKESKHTFNVDKPESPIFVDADSTRIIQIISNLLTNAAKYTPEGGSISLRVFQEGDEVVLSVIDSGIGIPPEQLSNIFTMFSQLTPALERSQGGLGIGLALVQGLVKLHGGTITAHSEGDGKGSEFIVRLPISNSAAEAPDAAGSSTNLIAESKCILVVDDNIDAAESLALLLELSGHKTKTAHNGMSGLELAEHFKPEVILLDIGLPDINGYEVAQQIRQQPWGANMFLIAATGWGQDKDKELAASAGFDKHLTKPIDFQQLNLLLQNISIKIKDR